MPNWLTPRSWPTLIHCLQCATMQMDGMGTSAHTNDIYPDFNWQQCLACSITTKSVVGTVTSMHTTCTGNTQVQKLTVKPSLKQTQNLPQRVLLLHVHVHTRPRSRYAAWGAGREVQPGAYHKERCCVWQGQAVLDERAAYQNAVLNYIMEI